MFRARFDSHRIAPAHRSCSARALALLFVVGLSGCGKQGEGERCDLNNGSFDDCESGLQCFSADQLSIEDGRGVALCCPIPPAQPSVDACRAGGTNLPEDMDPPAQPLDGGGQAPTDAGDSGT